MLTLQLIILALIIEIIYNPRIDITRVGDVILWYGKRNRKPIKLFNVKR